MDHLKHLSKYIRIELFSLELEEHNGDKEAYFLYMVQNELAPQYIAQYGKDRKTICIYEKETVYAVWQGRIPKSGRLFFKDAESKSTTVVLHLPKVYLATRERQHIIVKIKKVNPKWKIPLGQDIPTEFTSLDSKYLMKYDFDTRSFEIYEYAQWTVAGIRYRSEM